MDNTKERKRKWALENVDKMRASRKKYYQKNREAVMKRINNSQNPIKYKARYQLRHAVRDGKIIKGVCEICGKNEVEGHHEDYSKPLEVRWFCKIHHYEHHQKLLAT